MPTTQSIVSYVHTMPASPHRQADAAEDGDVEVITMMPARHLHHQASAAEDEDVELITMTSPAIHIVKPAPQRTGRWSSSS